MKRFFHQNLPLPDQSSKFAPRQRPTPSQGAVRRQERQQQRLQSRQQAQAMASQQTVANQQIRQAANQQRRDARLARLAAPGIRKDTRATARQDRQTTRLDRNQNRLDLNAADRRERKNRFSEEGRGMHALDTLAPYIPAFAGAFDTTVKGGLEVAKMMNPEYAAASSLGGGLQGLTNGNNFDRSGYEQPNSTPGLRDDEEFEEVQRTRSLGREEAQAAYDNIPEGERGPYDDPSYGTYSDDDQPLPTNLNGDNAFGTNTRDLIQSNQAKRSKYAMAIDAIAMVTGHNPQEVLEGLAQKGITLTLERFRGN